MKKKNDLTQYWRWQFLRLNESYIEDFRQAEERGSVANPSGEDLKYFLEAHDITRIVNPELKSLPADVQILGATHFAVRLGSIESIYGNIRKENQSIKPPVLFENVLENTRGKKDSLKKIKKELKATPTDWFGYTPPVVKAIQVVVNLDAGLEDIENGLHEIINRYAKEARYLRDAKRIEKHRAADLRQYLRAYQLQKQRGWTYKKIAIALGVKDDVEKDRNQEMVVKSHLKVANRLIRGDYRKIIL